MATALRNFYVLIESWAVYVKSEELFKEQGGETLPWGTKWVQVQAVDVEEARVKGIELRDRRKK